MFFNLRNLNYNFIKHSKTDRISNEKFMKQLHSLYISYVDPYTSDLLFIYNDNKLEYGEFIDNKIQNYSKNNNYNSIIDAFLIKNSDVLLKEKLVSGKWRENGDKIQFTVNEKTFLFNKNVSSFEAGGQMYYKVTDFEFVIDLLLLLSSTKNVYESNEIIKKNITVNSDGFGRGIVYKNFDYKNKIILD